MNMVAHCKITCLNRILDLSTNCVYSSCGKWSIHPVLPRGPIHWSNWQKQVGTHAHMMGFQLAGAAKERGGETANSPSIWDPGAAKYPPWAKGARMRDSSAHCLRHSPAVLQDKTITGHATWEEGNVTACAQHFIVRVNARCGQTCTGCFQSWRKQE